MIFQTNEHNSYKKNKETSKMTSFNYEKYEHSLNKLLSKLEPYLTIIFKNR